MVKWTSTGITCAFAVTAASSNLIHKNYQLLTSYQLTTQNYVGMCFDQCILRVIVGQGKYTLVHKQSFVFMKLYTATCKQNNSKQPSSVQVSQSSLAELRQPYCQAQFQSAIKVSIELRQHYNHVFTYTPPQPTPPGIVLISAVTYPILTKLEWQLPGTILNNCPAVTVIFIVQATFVLATFVHTRYILADTNPILTRLFGANF